MEKQDMMTAATFTEALQRRKFQVIHTGGTLTAWSFTYGSGEVVVTQDNSHEIDDDTLDTSPVMIGITTDVDRYETDHLIELSNLKQALEAIDYATDYIEADQTAQSCLSVINSFKA